MKGRLRLIFEDGYGGRFEMVEPISETIANSMACIVPPQKAALHPDIVEAMGLEPHEVPMNSFEETIEILRERQFRKELFVSEATRLGNLLAERMEDAEGWHDQSRVEPAKEQLRGR